MMVYRGDLVGLGPLSRDHLAALHRWVNDPEVMVPLSGHIRPKTRDDTTAWYEAIGKNDPNKATFLIYEITDVRPIGVCALDMNRLDQNAALSLWIGETSCWGKGYGVEATRLLIRHGFEQEGLHSIRLAVYADNERAIRAYTEVGFQATGRQREGVLKNGRFVDVIHMDILASEFSR
jgi:RimJ/RimL family protein N-acetyltransferase